MKNIKSKKSGIFLLAFAILLISQICFSLASTQLSSQIFIPYDVTNACNGANDLVVQVLPGACSPTLIRSDLLEDQNAFVFCQLTSVKYNPLIDISSIKSVTARPLNSQQGVSVSYYPARKALQTTSDQVLSSPFANNIGYLVLVVNRQPDEKKMPDSIKTEVELTINYASGNAFGFGSSQIYSREINTDANDYWALNYNKYSLFKGKFFIRVESIGQDGQGDYTNVALYRDATDRVSVVTLRPGQSQTINLPDPYCQASLIIKLNSLDYPKIKAQILVNDANSFVKVKDKISDTGCTLKTIDESNNKVTIDCPGKQFSLQLLPPNAEISFIKGTETIKDRYVAGDILGEKVYLAYMGNSKNANAEFRKNVPDKDFIVIADFSGYTGTMDTSDTGTLNTIAFTINRLLTTARETKSFSFLGKSDNVWKPLLRNIIEMTTSTGGKATVDSLTNSQVTSIGELEEKLNNAFNNKIQFKVILLNGATKDLGNLKTITFLNQNTNQDKKYTSALGKVLEEYYQKATYSYQEVYQAYGEEKGVKDYTEADRTFGEVSLMKLAKLSFYIGKQFSSIGFYNEIISAYKNKDSASEAQIEIQKISNKDFTKSTASVFVNGEFYTFSLENILPVSFDDKNAELTIDGKRSAYAEGDYLDDEGKITLVSILDDKVSIHVNDANSNSAETLDTISKGDANVHVFGTVINPIKVIVKSINYAAQTAEISVYAEILGATNGDYKTPKVSPYSIGKELVTQDDTGIGVSLHEINEDNVIVAIKVSSTQSQPDYIFAKDNTQTIVANGKNTIITLNKININKEASIYVQPSSEHGYTKTNVTVGVGIEKRAIQLSPEQTKNAIKSLDSAIKQFSGIRDALKETSKVMKAACMVTKLGLWLKNFRANLSGAGIARRKVMEQWKVVCAKEIAEAGGANNYMTYHGCFMSHAPAINSDVELMTKNINDINAKVKECRSQPGVIVTQKSVLSFFIKASQESINPQKFLEACLSQGKLEDYTNLEFTKTDPTGKVETIKLGDSLSQTNLDALIQNKNLGTEDIKSIYELIEIKQDCDSGQFSGEFCKGVESSLFTRLSELKKDAGTIIATKAAEENLQKSFSFANCGIIGSGNRDTSQNIIVTQATLQSDIRQATAAQATKLGIKEGDLISCIQTSSGVYIVKLMKNPLVNQQDSYEIEKAYSYSYNNEKEIITSLTELNGIFNTPNSLNILIQKSQTSTSRYKNNYLNPEVSYWESGQNKGLPAIVPLGKYYEQGWYVATEPYTVGNAYTEAGQLVSFYIGNVGDNNVMEFESASRGDDILQKFDLNTGQSLESFGALSSTEAKQLTAEAQKVIREASLQYGKAKNNKVAISGIQFKVGPPAVGTAGNAQCEDFMSPQDCHLLFNLCDPVMCPSSRCDFGGRYPVANVQETGIAGSLALCYPNYQEGIKLPICITGLYAGVDNLIVVLNATRECLNQSLTTGETVGICDQIKSFYFCDLFWRETLPLLKVGLSSVFETTTGRKSGGGEYFTVQDAFKTAEDSMNFFVNEYGQSSFAAFQARSTEEFGGDVCKMFFSSRVPGGKGFFENLLEPESPTQFTVSFEEIPATSATVPPVSHYKVYYRIYAGRDEAVTYSVYLKNPPVYQYYPVQQTYSVPGAIGSIAKGSYKDESPDFTAPSGYKEICVVINGRTQCGFKQVTTGFLTNELQSEYVASQATQSITTEKECVEGTASPQAFKLLSPNIQSTIEQSLNPEIYKTGIIRICATEQPDIIVDATRWRSVGYCGDERMKCWFDTHTLNNNTIKDLLILDQTKSVIDTMNEISTSDFLTTEESKSALDDAERLKKIAIDSLQEKFSVYGAGTPTQVTQTTSEKEVVSLLSDADAFALFKYDDTNVELPSGFQELDAAINKIGVSKITSIEIVGYASYEGFSTEKEHNQILSEDRAKAVQSYITKTYSALGNKITSVTGEGALEDFRFSAPACVAATQQTTKQTLEQCKNYLQTEINKLVKLTTFDARQKYAKTILYLANDRRVEVTISYQSTTPAPATLATTAGTIQTAASPNSVNADTLREEIETIIQPAITELNNVIDNSLNNVDRAQAQLDISEIYDEATRGLKLMVDKLEPEIVKAKETAAVVKEGVDLSKIKITIDAGHGGTDSGAVYGNNKEKDINLGIAELVKSKLLANGIGNVLMTRNSDVAVTLENRVKIANEANANLFVSIHSNSAGKSPGSECPDSTGTETYYYRAYDGSKILADKIQTSVVSSLGTKNRGTKLDSQSQYSSLYVLRKTNMPSALLEVGFICNKADLKILTEEQQKIADAIVQGILNYISGSSSLAQTEQGTGQSTSVTPITSEAQYVSKLFSDTINTFISKKMNFETPMHFVSFVLHEIVPSISVVTSSDYDLKAGKRGFEKEIENEGIGEEIFNIDKNKNLNLGTFIEKNVKPYDIIIFGSTSRGYGFFKSYNPATFEVTLTLDPGIEDTIKTEVVQFNSIKSIYSLNFEAIYEKNQKYLSSSSSKVTSVQDIPKLVYDTAVKYITAGEDFTSSNEFVSSVLDEIKGGNFGVTSDINILKTKLDAISQKTVIRNELSISVPLVHDESKLGNLQQGDILIINPLMFVGKQFAVIVTRPELSTAFAKAYEIKLSGRTIGVMEDPGIAKLKYDQEYYSNRIATVYRVNKL